MTKDPAGASEAAWASGPNLELCLRWHAQIDEREVKRVWAEMPGVVSLGVSDSGVDRWVLELPLAGVRVGVLVNCGHDDHPVCWIGLPPMVSEIFPLDWAPLAEDFLTSAAIAEAVLTLATVAWRLRSDVGDCACLITCEGSDTPQRWWTHTDGSVWVDRALLDPLQRRTGRAWIKLAEA